MINFKNFYKRVNFDIDYYAEERFFVKQNDTKSRGFYVKIIQDGRVVKPSASEKLTFYGRKPDGTDIFQDGVLDGEEFRIDLPNQAFTAPGDMRSEFSLRGPNGELISTKDFTITVIESFPMDPVESTDEFGALQSALAQIAGFAGELQDVQLFAESIKANLGELEDLDTDVKENVVAAINELNGKIDNVLNSEELETLLNAKVDKDTLGDMSQLETEEKEILVLAINELFNSIEEVKEVSDVSTLLPLLNSKADKSTVGDIANLVDFEDEEVEINNLVEAVNYTYQLLVASLEGLGEINLEGFALSEDLGDKEELTTDDKTNLVNAINEINAALKTVESVTDVEQLSILLSGKADKSSVGNLANLTTTQKNNLVAAINEINAIIDGLGEVDFTEIYNLLDGKVNQDDFDLAVSTLQTNIDNIELGGVDQDFIDTVENNKFRVNFIWGKHTDLAYLFTNQDLETINFSNFDLPGYFYRDNWIPGVSYDMYGMFSGATFPTPPPGDPFDWEWDPDIPDSNFWKWFMNFETWMDIEPSSLENMFANATGDVIMLPKLMIMDPISARGMFSGARVNEIDLGWGFGYRINDMSRMFLWVSNPDGGPTEVDLSRLETGEVTDMNNMFYNSKFTTLDLSSFDTSNVTNMSEMFMETQATTLDLSSFDTSNVTDMNWMFRGTKIPTLDLSSFDTSSITSMRGMFYNCQATTLDLSSFDTSNVTDMGSMFLGSQATTLDLSSFDTSNVTSMYAMFHGSQATTLDLSSFDTSNVTNMGWMFVNSQATTLDLSSFDTSNVTDMGSMFLGSQATTLDLSSFDTSNVTDMGWMFKDSQATTLDLSSFDTSNVTDMFEMFYNSQATTLDLSSFDTSNVTDMRGMFQNCKATTGYARTQADADRFNASSGKPSSLNFVVHPDLV